MLREQMDCLTLPPLEALYREKSPKKWQFFSLLTLNCSHCVTFPLPVLFVFTSNDPACSLKRLPPY